jgi:hypothetical protein
MVVAETPRTPVTRTAVCGELRVPLALHPSGNCKPQILRNTGVRTIEAGGSANSVKFSDVRFCRAAINPEKRVLNEVL